MENEDILFTPVSLGKIELGHRVVMAPLTRSRSVQPNSEPGDLMRKYYEQRASKGGLIISEATNISKTSRGWLGAPGLYLDSHIKGWKAITNAVAAKGSVMVAQLWHTGRSSHTAMTDGIEPVSASVDSAYWQNPNHLVSIPGGWVQPSPHRALDTTEIQGIVVDYREAAKRAKEAGFEGVELHAANGYLIDQFLQDGSNQRTDAYGGSIENRARILFEVVEALLEVWGPGRVAVRIGPNGRWNGMSDSDPKALFSYVASQLNGYDLSYLHLIEPRIAGSELINATEGATASRWIRNIYKGKLIAAGGFEPDTARTVVSEGALDAVAFGRYFVSNPDLADRLRHHLPLAPYDRDTFYTFEDFGYTDYPSHPHALEA